MLGTKGAPCCIGALCVEIKEGGKLAGAIVESDGVGVDGVAASVDAAVIVSIADVEGAGGADTALAIPAVAIVT
jgi:hypothetical protein